MLLAATLAVAGPASPAAAAERDTVCNVVTGADSNSQQVARLYKAVFHRTPEPRGWNYWKGVHADSSLFTIADFFVEAPEFVNLYGQADNRAFVRLIYQNVLGRDPDDGGYNYWLGLLSSGQVIRAEMVVYFSESAEFKRRENEQYFELCAQLAPTDPTVVVTNVYDVNVDPAFVHRVFSYQRTRDGRDNSTAYGFRFEEGFGDGNSYMARRKSGESCATWRIVPHAVLDSAQWNSRLVHEWIWSTAPGNGGSDLGTEARAFSSEVDSVVDGYPVDSCVADEGVLAASSASRFEVLPDLGADEVGEAFGLVVRRIGLGTEEVRQLLASGDASIRTLIPRLTDELAAVDARNAELRRQGRGHLANSRIQLSLTLWEDHTGNLLQMHQTYDLRMIEDDLEEWRYLESTLIVRGPTE